MALTSDQLYQTLKQYEELLPIPTQFATINVGAFDASLGVWKGLTTTVVEDPEPIEHTSNQHPTNPAPKDSGSEYISVTIDEQWRQTTTTVPAPIVPIEPVQLQFTVENFSAAWSVTVNGFTQNVPAGQTTATVNAWDRTIIPWSIQTGAKGHSDNLRVQRNTAIPIFGGFTIPVLPVAIVYAPPADSQGRSSASYSKQTDTVGTTVSWDLNTDSSQTTEPTFTDGSAFKAFLGVVSTALSDTAQGDASASKDLSSFASLIPSEVGTQQQGTINDNGGSVTVSYSQTSTLSTTAAGGGPGVGDNIVFYKNVRVAWAYDGGSWQLYPFGWTLVIVTVAALQNQLAQLGISSTDQQILLSLDPFVAGGAFATPPAGRFTLPPNVESSIEYGGGIGYVQTYATTRDTKSTTTTKSYNTDTSTWDPGTLLRMFGLETEKTQVTTTITNATGTEVSDTGTLNVNLVSGASDLFAIQIWYDNLFGRGRSND